MMKKEKRSSQRYASVHKLPSLLNRKVDVWLTVGLLIVSACGILPFAGCQPLGIKYRGANPLKHDESDREHSSLARRFGGRPLTQAEDNDDLEDDWAPPRTNAYTTAKRFPRHVKSGMANDKPAANMAPAKSTNEALKSSPYLTSSKGPTPDATADTPADPAKLKVKNSNVRSTDVEEMDLEGALATLPPNLQDVLKRQLDAIQNREVTATASVPNHDAAVDKKTVNESQVASSDSNAPTNKAPADSHKVQRRLSDSGTQKDVANVASATNANSTATNSTATNSGLANSGPANSAKISSPLDPTFGKQNNPAQSSADVSVAVAIAPASESALPVQTAAAVQPHPTDGDIKGHSEITQSIAKLEKQIADCRPGDDSVRLSLEVSLRMLYLANRQLDEAMRPIEGLSEYEREYFRHQVQALYEASDPEAIPVKGRRYSSVMDSQRAATNQLAAVSNLDVKNAAFCTDVQGYGVTSKFGNYMFKQDQDLLLYCELENVAAERVKEGFETQLQGSYEIVDSNGQRVADQLLPMEKEICKNHRRDYFIVYRIYTPLQIAAGNYQLRLTIEDMKAKKYGQSTIDFQIQK